MGSYISCMEPPAATEENREVEKEKISPLEFEKRVFENHDEALTQASAIPQPRSYKSGSVKIMIY